MYRFTPHSLDRWTRSSWHLADIWWMWVCLNYFNMFPVFNYLVFLRTRVWMSMKKIFCEAQSTVEFFSITLCLAGDTSGPHWLPSCLFLLRHWLCLPTCFWPNGKQIWLFNINASKWWLEHFVLRANLEEVNVANPTEFNSTLSVENSTLTQLEIRSNKLLIYSSG